MKRLVRDSLKLVSVLRVLEHALEHTQITGSCTVYTVHILSFLDTEEVMEVDVENGDCILTPESVCQETGRRNLHQKKVWRYTVTDGDSGQCFDEDVSCNGKTVYKII